METETDSIMRGDGPWWGEREGTGGVGSLCKSQFSNLRTDSWYAGGGDIWQLQTSFTTFNKFSNNRKYFSCLINKSGQIVLNWQSEEIVNHYLPSTTLGWQLLSWGVKCNNCWNIYFLCSAPFFWLLMFFGWSKNNIQYLERTLATAAINTHTTHNLLLPASYENQ